MPTTTDTTSICIHSSITIHFISVAVRLPLPSPSPDLPRMDRSPGALEDLPEGWRSRMDPSTGHFYFWHVGDPSGTTTWTRPGQAACAPRSSDTPMASSSSGSTLPKASSVLPATLCGYPSCLFPETLEDDDDWERIQSLQTRKRYLHHGRDEKGHSLTYSLTAV